MPQQSKPGVNWDLCMPDIHGRPLRIGPWPKRQAENLAYHQRLWHRSIGCKDKVSVEPHDSSYIPPKRA